MTLSLTCTHCGVVLAGDDEDELVAQVQTHVRGHARDHGRDHAISREQILARLHREQSKQQPPTEKGQ